MSTFAENFLVGTPKSFQRTTVTIATGQTSGTATISAVNANRVALTHLGSRGPITNNQDFQAEIGLTNSTTVRAQRAGSTGDLVVGVQVVEYY